MVKAVLTGALQARVVWLISNHPLLTGQTMPKKHEINSEHIKHAAATILAARMTAGISQRELSRRVTVTQPLISSWEKAKAMPSLPYIIQIEQALNMPQGELLNAIAYGFTSAE